jgi:hypothetical protein
MGMKLSAGHQTRNVWVLGLAAIAVPVNPVADTPALDAHVLGHGGKPGGLGDVGRDAGTNRVHPISGPDSPSARWREMSPYAFRVRRLRRRLVISIKDIGWLLTIVLLLPLAIAVVAVGLVVITARQLYWWARGNTAASRARQGAGSSWRQVRWSRPSCPRSGLSHDVHSDGTPAAGQAPPEIVTESIRP